MNTGSYYDSQRDSFQGSYNGINDDNPEKLAICKKLAENLRQYASQFETIYHNTKWNLKTDVNNCQLHINIYYNTAKKQYKFKVFSSKDKKAYKFNIRQKTIRRPKMYGGPDFYK